jgi:hypothetical protein
MNSLRIFIFHLFLITSLGYQFNGTIEKKQIFPPPINGCFIVDAKHELLIGPPSDRDKAETPNLWMIFAYTLDAVLIFILAVFFRIYYIRNGKTIGVQSDRKSGTPTVRFGGGQSTIII